MDDVKEGYVPSAQDFEDLAAKMQAAVADRVSVLFEGRIVHGRVKHGAFIANDPAVRERMLEAQAEAIRESAVRERL